MIKRTKLFQILIICLAVFTFIYSMGIWAAKYEAIYQIIEIIQKLYFSIILFYVILELAPQKPIVVIIKLLTKIYFRLLFGVVLTFFLTILLPANGINNELVILIGVFILFYYEALLEIHEKYIAIINTFENKFIKKNRNLLKDCIIPLTVLTISILHSILAHTLPLYILEIMKNKL